MNDRQMTNIIRVYGIVQGVGFRPFVSRSAVAAGLNGSVANKGSYVEIYATGTKEQINCLVRDLHECPPERSAILKIDIEEIEKTDYESFEIIESEKEAGDIFVSPDIATCPKCRRELYDPSDRRYMHPFINCTACGPRVTILDAMPYDRERTSMGEFPMCPECESEYTDPATRRYDAQPVCCNDCGPEVYMIGSGVRGREAITAARQAIMDGKIIAIKGIGGFHLCCDATCEAAVARLRELKRRPAKPFAVMMQDIETVRRECLGVDEKEEVLEGHQKPIILLPRRDGGHLAPSVAPGNPKVGVMLPYAPVQMLLFDYDDGLEMTTDCFVMTSGNVSGAPICRTDEDAKAEIAAFCDDILSHDRKIRLRADDSVMDYYKGKPYMIRRSRGYAPLPFMLSEKFSGSVLAIGGELKNTFCVAKNQLLYPSPYVGDMADLRTVNALRESVKRMSELLEAEPELVVCDMHPKYNTTLVAEEMGLPVMKIQHHYAHVLSCMAENDFMGQVIGVSFDGTGYGTDGTIWGGEVLISDCEGFDRGASIVPFLQIGGDASAKEGWRIALAMVNALYGEDAEQICQQLGLCEPGMQKLYLNMARKKINCVNSTSAGRLFDAVSAILGICKKSSFEGEASTSLEFAAERFEATSGLLNVEQIIETYPNLGKLKISSEDGRLLLPTDELVRVIVDQKLLGTDSEQLACLFHQMLSYMITQACQVLEQTSGLRTVALSGGVFQNQMLLRLCDEAMTAAGLTVLKHSLVPPNDGGLCLGQALAGMYELKRERKIKSEE